MEAVWKLSGLSWKYEGDRRLAEAPWILADVARKQFPFASVDQQRAQVRRLREKGYITIYDADGYVVLERP